MAPSLMLWPITQLGWHKRGWWHLYPLLPWPKQGLLCPCNIANHWTCIWFDMYPFTMDYSDAHSERSHHCASRILHSSRYSGFQMGLATHRSLMNHFDTDGISYSLLLLYQHSSPSSLPNDTLRFRYLYPRSFSNCLELKEQQFTTIPWTSLNYLI